MRTPAQFYAPSPRAFPETISDPEYPAHFDLLRVYSNGNVGLNQYKLNLGRVLQNEVVGFEQIDDAQW